MAKSIDCATPIGMQWRHAPTISTKFKLLNANLGQIYSLQVHSTILYTFAEHGFVLNLHLKA